MAGGFATVAAQAAVAREAGLLPLPAPTDPGERRGDVLYRKLGRTGETRLRASIAETGRTPPENPTPQQAWDIRAATVPLKVGWLQPEDISPAAVFLASDAAAMVTGAEYEVTGGDSAKDI